MAGRWANYVAFGVKLGLVLLLVQKRATAVACFYFSIHFYL